MFTEGALRIELHRGSKITALEIQAERALIGSGAHCDVRLAPDEAAIEQLSLRYRTFARRRRTDARTGPGTRTAAIS